MIDGQRRRTLTGHWLTTRVLEEVGRVFSALRCSHRGRGSHAPKFVPRGWEREGRAPCGKRPQFLGIWRPPSMLSAWWHRRTKVAVLLASFTVGFSSAFCVC